VVLHIYVGARLCRRDSRASLADEVIPGTTPNRPYGVSCVDLASAHLCRLHFGSYMHDRDLNLDLGARKLTSRCGRGSCVVKYFTLIFAWLCLCTGSALAQRAGDESSSGKCFAFHGRFAVYTGDSQQTLWPVGTYRLLRPEYGTEPLLKLLGNDISTLDDYFIFGDFIVCPLEKEIPGHIRSVYIKSARNLRRVKRKASA
jgi:hypothetical protein